MITLIKVLLFCCFTQTVIAETVDDSQPVSVWQLSAKPRFCVIPHNKKMCKMSTELSWKGQKKSDICLSSSQYNTVLQCWLSALKGVWVEEISSDKSIGFWLALQGGKEILVKTNIKIISLPQKRIRTRRRHIWSLL